MKTDFGGYTYSNYREMMYKLNSLFYSHLMQIILFLKGIKIGNCTIFYNKAYFYRCPESKINIGNNCIFDSAKLHNLVGVNTRCIISTMSKHAQLYIGNSVGFSGVKISCAEKIIVGDGALMGANILMTDSDWHSLDPVRRDDKDLIRTKPIKIGNNVFVGANSIILKGTEIGDNSVIGAGSVVAGIIPSNVIAAGNPCKVIKAL